MKALYSLNSKIAGFDFFFWLAAQVRGGATEIVFDITHPNTKKWDRATVMRRFDSIVKPGPALAGLPYSFGREGYQLGAYGQRAFLKTFAAWETFPRLRSVLPPGNEQYTITLRNTERSPTRNSDEKTWREFAKEIGARVIPDYQDQTIHLHDRMALYAGADMNFFDTNGPIILCFMSEAPAMGFDCQNAPMVKQGVPLGNKYPFCLDQHFQIYEPATADAIRRHFYEWRDSKGRT